MADVLFYAQVDHGKLNNFRQRQTIPNGNMARQTVNMIPVPLDIIEIPTVNLLSFEYDEPEKMPKSACRDNALQPEMIINVSLKTGILPFQF